MSWKYWNLFNRREKIKDEEKEEEKEEEEGKVGYFRFEERHTSIRTRTHISYTHTQAYYYYEPTKRLFDMYYTVCIHHIHISKRCYTVCNDTFLYGIAICQSFLKLDANPNKKMRHTVFSTSSSSFSSSRFSCGKLLYLTVPIDSCCVKSVFYNNNIDSLSISFSFLSLSLTYTFLYLWLNRV